MSATIKCIAIDDEPLALKLIENFSKQIPFLDLIGTYLNPLTALEVLKTDKIDLMFLDIRMPDITGFQFLNTLQEKPLVILTTAYNQYGPESYEFDVVDYLIKPFSIEKFLKACNKAKKIIDDKSESIESAVVAPVKDDFIFVNSEYKLIKIRFSEILFIEGLKDYIKIFLDHSENPVLTIMRIKTFEENLPPSDFIRVHRSFMININKIDYVKKSKVFIGKHEIPIGEIYANAFQKVIEGKNWK